ncbi:hypothetical protein H634G_10660 [Metarhizium anisopliae BRIP 53293]|uniref:Uncharacterized protein n=1 Tax=Metarhizium anisopliae BRIP 53293 TaxID=1291518 RepID=A0A0D9NJJ3_METAN|nr:hypothetical protein H634G_10660 [Metarhizium anisopliae BRIP 53293]
MSDKDSTLFIGDSDPTCPAGMTPQPDGYVSGQSYQQTYQKFSCSRIDMYLGNILPEWPIFTPDEVLAMRQKYLAGQGSDNDRLSMLVIIDLADTMNPFHSQDIQELQFGLRYRRTIQTHALLALYWKRRGFHGFANEHITKAVALGPLLGSPEIAPDMRIQRLIL